MSVTKSFNHAIIAEAHPKADIYLDAFVSMEQIFKIDNSRTFAKKLLLQFQHCPECACEDVEKFGYSSVGTQRYRCKRVSCRRQFVSQRDSIYPKQTRRDTFYKEFDLEQNKYWKPYALEVLMYIESHKGKLLINRILKHYFDRKIITQQEYDTLTFSIVHEIYNIVSAR